ncbi:MAG TPA: GNAT family N-acetyltransferase [Thermoanaerobaculia bacterium]|nr:GNAT family N-acetyltransferase [Thermoanaerobaculia bacterium]
MITLITPRLRMVPVSLGDVDVLHAMWRDPDVRRYLWDDVEIERDTAAAVVAESVRDWERHRYGLWLLHEHEQAIGFAGFRPSEEEPELVFGLLPHAWHRGLATEAAAAVLHYLFEVLGHDGAWAETDAPNTASQRVLERLGMRFDAASGRWLLTSTRRRSPAGRS